MYLALRLNNILCCVQIRAIDRKQEVPHDGPMCDLLWSDPEGACSQADSLIPKLSRTRD